MSIKNLALVAVFCFILICGYYADDVKEDDNGNNIVEDSKIEDNKEGDSKVEDGKVEDSKIEDNKEGDSKVEDGKVEDSKIEDNKEGDSKVEDNKEDNKNDNNDDEILTKNGRNGTVVENPKQGGVNETVTKTPSPPSEEQDTKRPVTQVPPVKNATKEQNTTAPVTQVPVVKNATEPTAKTNVVQDQSSVPVQEKNFLGIALMILLGLFISGIIVYVSRK